MPQIFMLIAPTIGFICNNARFVHFWQLLQNTICCVVFRHCLFIIHHIYRVVKQYFPNFLIISCPIISHRPELRTTACFQLLFLYCYKTIFCGFGGNFSQKILYIVVSQAVFKWFFAHNILSKAETSCKTLLIMIYWLCDMICRLSVFFCFGKNVCSIFICT